MPRKRKAEDETKDERPPVKVVAVIKDREHAHHGPRLVVAELPRAVLEQYEVRAYSPNMPDVIEARAVRELFG